MIEKTLDGLCAELRNYFVKKIYSGTFAVSGGSITPGGIAANQYICIVGSVFNDGVHKYPLTGLVDETFTGEIWAMAVPPSAIALAEDIEKFNKDVEERGLLDKGYASESFGGYSYTLKDGAPLHLVQAERNIKRAKARWRKI
jgi:hypothetical protein